MLNVKNLFFNYPERSIFSGWKHSFLSGVTWVKGSNGCGKTTLLKLLAGALKPSMGEIELSGINQSAESLQYRQQIYYCGPGPIVFDHLTPSEFFGFMRNLYPNCQEESLKQHIEGLNLMPFQDVQLKHLSTGTQRKVWLAFALAAETKATLLDEPFNAIDANSLEYLRAALGRCSKDLSKIWIVASHQDLGDEILVTETLSISS
jgi:ABC-type multidrug transport system ATPase subunit